MTKAISGSFARERQEYIIDSMGKRKAVVLGLKEYEAILDLIEDLQDANDLLKAEREATSFIPYEEFRRTWVQDHD